MRKDLERECALSRLAERPWKNGPQLNNLQRLLLSTVAMPTSDDSQDLTLKNLSRWVLIFPVQRKSSKCFVRRDLVIKTYIQQTHDSANTLILPSQVFI